MPNENEAVTYFSDLEKSLKKLSSHYTLMMSITPSSASGYSTRLTKEKTKNKKIKFRYEFYTGGKLKFVVFHLTLELLKKIRLFMKIDIPTLFPDLVKKNELKVLMSL